jgi:hypothetical protein
MVAGQEDYKGPTYPLWQAETRDPVTIAIPATGEMIVAQLAEDEFHCCGSMNRT